MTVSVLRSGDYAVVPWANGAGVTREVARSPLSSGADFDWRVSIADVPPYSVFSAFPGVDRVLVPLSEPALVLTVDGAEHLLVQHEPFAFDGAAVVGCRVDGGPSQDLNVMTRRGRSSAAVSVLDAATITLDADGFVTVAVVLTGTRATALDVGPPVRLDALDALTLDGRSSAGLDGQGLVAIIRFT